MMERSEKAARVAEMERMAGEAARREMTHLPLGALANPRSAAFTAMLIVASRVVIKAIAPSLADAARSIRRSRAKNRPQKDRARLWLGQGKRL